MPQFLKNQQLGKSLKVKPPTYHWNKARPKAIKEFEEKGIFSCEIRIDSNCVPNYFLAFAHRHKMGWYRKRLHLIAKFSQIIKACQYCHNEIEHNSELTESVFKRLRD